MASEAHSDKIKVWHVRVWIAATYYPMIKPVTNCPSTIPAVLDELPTDTLDRIAATLCINNKGESHDT